jgi:hypothetical protein
MVEPSTSNHVKRLSNFKGMAPPSAGRREELAWSEDIPQEVLAGQPRVVLLPGEAGIGKARLLQELRSDALRHGLQVGYGRGYEDPTLPYLPFVEILQALLDQSPLENKQIFRTNLQDWAEFHYWVRLARRRDQDIGPCRAHYEEPIKTYRLAGNVRGLADVLVEKTQTYLTFASVPLCTLIDLRSLYQSNTESPPVLRCARPY